MIRTGASAIIRILADVAVAIIRTLALLTGWAPKDRVSHPWWRHVLAFLLIVPLSFALGWTWLALELPGQAIASWPLLLVGLWIAYWGLTYARDAR